MSASFTPNVKPGVNAEIARKTKKPTSDICIDRFYHVDSIPITHFDGYGCAISEVSSS
jgi:hypothetical protein